MPIHTLSETAMALAFTFPIGTVCWSPRLGALAFCASTCASPDRRLVRRGSLSSLTR